MHKVTKIIVYTTLIVIFAGVVFLYFSNRGAPSIEVSPETRERLKETTPLLSEDENAYFSLLEQNAISAGPPKDGIPSIDNPQYTNAAEADTWLLAQDVVFGVEYENFIAAYPQRIVVWHEIVNEEVAGEKISVTYCPLTGTAIGFKGEYAPGISAQFGVSGKLINSNLLMYDRESDSYWPQILGKAITDPAKGAALKEFPVVWTTWEKWKNKHPETLVLSRDTGFFRNYGQGGDPYGSYLQKNNMGYYSSDRLLFQPIYDDDRLSPKEVVVGIRDTEGNALAILKEKLRQEKTIEVPFGDTVIILTYDEKLDFYEARTKTGEWINAFDAMWFSWTAFYPETKLLQ